MSRFPGLCAIVVAASCLATPGLAELCEEKGEFDPARSAVEQMVAAAAALGIAENEITRAIQNGQYAPMPEDVKRAVIELDTRTCEDIRALWIEKGQWNDQNPTECEIFRFSESAKLWPERFGRFDDEEVIFRLAQRDNGTSADLWVKQDTQLDDVRYQPIVMAMMIKARETSNVVGFMCLRSVNVGSPGDFAGRYEETRRNFEESQGISRPDSLEPSLMTTDSRDDKMMEALSFQNGFLNIDVAAIEVGFCKDLSTDVVLCNFRTRDITSGGAVDERGARVFGQLLSLRGWRWATFRTSGEKWELLENFKECYDVASRTTCVNWVREY